jgi:hypothetical protein
MEITNMKRLANTIYAAGALLAFACFAVSPSVLAVVPAPDGGYPGNNTAEGDYALFSLTTGYDNTAIGFNALFGDTPPSVNYESNKLQNHNINTINDHPNCSPHLSTSKG